MRRREFLTGAAALAGLTSQAEALGLGKLGAGRSLGVLGKAGNSLVWRGMGQGMKAYSLGFTGTATRSIVTRTPHTSNVAFRYFRVVLPLFYSGGNNPVTDILCGINQTFQVGFEASYANATTGLSARIPVTFSGQNYVDYDHTNPPATGYLVSDIIDAGAIIAAGATFGFHTCVESPASGNAQQFYNRFLSNFKPRFIGQTISSSSQIVGKGGATDVALTATSVTPSSSSQTSTDAGYVPGCMLIQVPAATKCVFQWGDSNMHGDGAAINDLLGVGDVFGDQAGNCGFHDAGVYESAGIIGVNVGRGADGVKFTNNPSNTIYRRALQALINPTHLLNGYGTNDFSITTVPGAWAQSTTYPQFTVVLTGSAIYMATSITGTSAGTGTGPAGTGSAIQDGTVTWAWLSSTLTLASERCMLQWGNNCNFASQIQAISPSAKIIGVAPPPNSTSSFAITSLTSSGTTATATVASTTNITNGSTLTIAGAAPSAYNGSYVVTVVNGTTFTYTFAGGTSPATGTITYSDNWATVVNQSTTSNTVSERGFWNVRGAALDPLALYQGWIDPNTGKLESSANSCKWQVSAGAAFPYCADGIHTHAGGDQVAKPAFVGAFT